MSPEHEFAANLARFTGFADLYDRHRPQPPAVLATLIAQVTGIARPALVVDLGSGTGLSTRYWADRADRVMGLEPTADMRRQAEAVTTAANVSYREGFSHATSLPEHGAQVVVCLQALHWMDPERTFAEAARILEPGGAFVACDYDWPPLSGAWEADAAFEACIRTGRRLERERKLASAVKHWDKSGHFARMQSSGMFRHVRDVAVHHQDEGNAARLEGLLQSQGYIAALRRAGVSEDELGITTLRAVAQRTLGDTPRPFLWCARVRLGVV
ncbi:MAG: class I SAM-dependent methyltransferase [Opitutales bacterium]